MSYSAGQRLTAAQLNNPTPSGNVVAGGTVQATTTQAAGDTQITSGTTTSTSYTATLSGGTACGFAFTAPASGVVFLSSSCWMSNSLAGANATTSTIRVRTGATVGSGSDVLAAGDDLSIVVWGSNTTNSMKLARVTGLTPGASYNAQQLFRVTAGTGTYLRKYLDLVPAL